MDFSMSLMLFFKKKCGIRHLNIILLKVVHIAFYAPALIDQGHIVFGLYVCLFVCWSVCPFVCPYNFYIGHILRLVRVTAFYNTILTFNDLKPLTDNKILDLSKLKQIADNILKCI